MTSAARVTKTLKPGLWSADASRHWSERARVFLACAFLNLAPLLYFRFIPTNDGPTHVYNAAMLRLFWCAPHASAGKVFVWNASLPPNLLTHSVLAVLLSWLNPIVAERLLVIFYALLLPVAFRYFLRSVASRTHGLEYLSLAWVYNSHLHWGFYNFLFSIVLFLFASGYWLRKRQHVNIPSIVTLTGLATLLYFSHPVGLMQFWIACCAMAFFERACGKASWSGVLLLAPALTVSGVLYLHYALARIPSPGEITDWPSSRYAASLLFTLSPLASYSPSQRLIAVAIPLFLVALALVKVERGRLATLIDPYCFAAAISAGLVFLAPSSTGGGTMLTPRLVYVPFALVSAWLVNWEWPVDSRYFAPVLGFVLAFAMIASNWSYYSRYNLRMHQFMAVEDLWPQNSYLLFRPAGPSTLLLDETRTPFISSAAVGYLAAERHQVLMGDYQAARNYFPLLYQPRLPKALYSYAADMCPGKDLETQAASGTELFPLHAAVFVVSTARAETTQCFVVPPSSRFETNGVEVLYYRLPPAETSRLVLR